MYSKTIIATAAALFAAGTIASTAQAQGSIKCAGTNSCKGQGSCKSQLSSCKGQNACKGQSWTAANNTLECTAIKSGRVVM